MTIPPIPGDPPDPHASAPDAIRPGVTLAERYVIQRALGAGGMATVHLADDLRHRRQVAIKVLHAELSAVLGPERFLKEIELTASLQHPHILPLFDSGSVNGLLYYVMPYVEGETLRARLAREKQLPVADAVRIASEAAAALDYAHRRGVVHRDIKPENILLHDGAALVADFGIALAVRSAGGERMTQTGLSLGTPQYMSPEQAMGEREIGPRSDIYSLGAVTYEMLAGEAPFTGPTAQAIVAKVLTDDPPHLTAQRRSVPPHVSDAVRIALEKIPADRFADAKSFAEALATPGAASSAAYRATSPASGRRVLVLTVLLAAAILTSVGGWTAWYRASRATAGSALPTRLALLVPTLGGSGVGTTNRSLTLTPDGSAVLYVAGRIGDRGDGGLRRQALDEETATPIPRTDQLGYAPSLSPDGRWIATRNPAGALMLYPAIGPSGNVSPVANGFAFYAWHPDGSLWVTQTPYRRVDRLVPGSDSLQPMLSLERGLWLQQILDDGRTAIVIDQGIGASTGPCALLDLQTGSLTTLIATPIVAARYTAGYLVWAAPDGSLIAQAFDPKGRRLKGQPSTIATGVSITGIGDAQFDVARNGTVVYVPEEPRSLVLVDRRGGMREATAERHAFHMPRFSPDGRRITTDFVTGDGRDVWQLDLGQATLTRLTFDRDGHDATWMPDGHAITYSSNRAGVLGTYRVRPGTMAPAESLLASPQVNFTGEWVPDASRLVTVASDLRPGSGQDIAVVQSAGRGPIEPLVATQFQETYPAVSHDGRWLAFVSGQSGRDEVYVRPLADSGSVIQVSQGGGTEPVWSRRGHELFYRGTVNGAPTLISTRIETEPSLVVATRQPLFPVAEYLSTIPHANFDVSPDGASFVMVRANAASRIVVLQNLPALMARDVRSREVTR